MKTNTTKKAKSVVALLLSFILTFTVSASSFAADSTARKIIIYKIEGKNVTMTKGTVKSFTAKEKTSLSDGYTVSAGNASYCYLKLDNVSFVKIDQNSKIQISKVSSKKISISVLSGGIYTDAAPQLEGEVLEVKAGNSALAIRGTLFTAEYLTDNEFAVTMLEGKGDVDGKALDAGKVMYVYDRKTPEKHQTSRSREITALKVDKSVSLFTLKTIQEYKDKLINKGVITKTDAEGLAKLIETKEAEVKEQKAQNDAKIKQIKANIGNNKNAVIRPGGDLSGSNKNSPGNDNSPPSGGQNDYQPPYIPPVIYTVTYDLNGANGATPATLYISAGNTFTAAGKIGFAMPAPYADDTLITWNTKPDGTGVDYTPGSVYTPTASLTLYAIWEGNVTVFCHIRTVDDLKKVGSGTDGWTLAANYRLMNDIDASKPADGYNRAIGDYVSSFDGIFDGQEHKIELALEDKHGLFSDIGTSGVIKNVTVGGSVVGNINVGSIAGVNAGNISNCHSAGNVTGSGSDNGDWKKGVGGVVGCNDGGNVSNCSSTGNVTGNGNAGGVVGSNDGGDVSNCHSTGNVNGGGDCSVGGVVGFNTGNILDCHSTGNVTSGVGGIFVFLPGGIGTGGVVGRDVSGDISNCYSTGNVTNGGDSATGGVLGSSLGGTVSYCYSTGEVNGVNNVGGVVGENYGAVSYCHSTGEVNGVDDVGGVVGSNFGTVSYCYSERNVRGNGSVGGVVGDNDHGDIINCHAAGYVEGGGAVGGVLGSNRNNCNVINCYATGNVSGSNDSVGGVVGFNEWNVINCYATGNVSGNSSVGGLIGWDGGVDVSNCYASGNVTGNDAVGGLAGTHFGAHTISNSVALGENIFGGTAANRGRIAGENSAALSGNYARQDMNLSGSTITSGDDTSKDGADVTAAQFNQQSFWDYTMLSLMLDTWDFINVWRWSSTLNRPVLRNMPGTPET